MPEINRTQRVMAILDEQGDKTYTELKGTLTKLGVSKNLFKNVKGKWKQARGAKNNGVRRPTPQPSQTMREPSPSARTAAPTSKPTSTARKPNVDDLFKVKQLAQQLGGLAKLKASIETLERLSG